MQLFQSGLLRGLLDWSPYSPYFFVMSQHYRQIYCECIFLFGIFSAISRKHFQRLSLPENCFKSFTMSGPCFLCIGVFIRIGKTFYLFGKENVIEPFRCVCASLSLALHTRLDSSDLFFLFLNVNGSLRVRISCCCLYIFQARKRHGLATTNINLSISRSVLDNVDLLKDGLPGALVTALIMGVHEISHFIVAKEAGIKLGVPYFVPSWQVRASTFLYTHFD